MVKKKTKIAKVPEDVWERNMQVAHSFGFNTATTGFRITDKLLRGDYQLKKRKKRGNKYVWELELEDLL